MPGVPCPQLDENFRCRIFTQPERPACCAGLKPSQEMCGDNRNEALVYLSWLEKETAIP
jgi:hypothetical protein